MRTHSAPTILSLESDSPHRLNFFERFAGQGHFARRVTHVHLNQSNLFSCFFSLVVKLGDVAAGVNDKPIHGIGDSIGSRVNALLDGRHEVFDFC